MHLHSADYHLPAAVVTVTMAVGGSLAKTLLTRTGTAVAVTLGIGVHCKPESTLLLLK